MKIILSLVVCVFASLRCAAGYLDKEPLEVCNVYSVLAPESEPESDEETLGSCSRASCDKADHADVLCSRRALRARKQRAHIRRTPRHLKNSQESAIEQRSVGQAERAPVAGAPVARGGLGWRSLLMMGLLGTSCVQAFSPKFCSDLLANVQARYSASYYTSVSEYSKLPTFKTRWLWTDRQPSLCYGILWWDCLPGQNASGLAKFLEPNIRQEHIKACAEGQFAKTFPDFVEVSDVYGAKLRVSCGACPSVAN